ncbi:MAG: sugar phosphate isomerase/epimerase, partial [Christensenellaceae bacterium]|nr:sugar phosphate isomerase/epimerase [Christensenellaceae bacterium]
MLLSTQTDFLSRFFGDEEALCRIRTVGFDAADFDFFQYGRGERKNPLLLPEEGFLAYFARLHELCEGMRLVIGQTHAPFPLYRGDGQDEARLNLQRRAIWASAILGAPCMAAHPAKPKDYDPGTMREGALELNFRLFSGLIPCLEEHGVVLALENLFSYDENGEVREAPGSLPGELNRLVDALNEQSPRFAACLDTGHALIMGVKPQEFALKLGKRLRIIHAQDNDGRHDQHLLPGLGRIDWKKFLKALKQAK